MQVEVVETPELGDRSYLVHDGTVAVAVDPQRDIDRVLERLEVAGLTLQAVVETHIHNDYVTGGLALARRCGADYLVAATEDVSFERTPVADGQELSVGAMRLRVIATPGHTDGHVAYAITGATTPDRDEPVGTAVLTGGSLLFGSVGRTDLVDPRRAEELTRAQYRSVRRLAAHLPADIAIYPTHGFGSFCSSGAATGGAQSTIAQERQVNDALTTPDEDVFVAALLAGLTAYPAYYARMAPLNRYGPAEPSLTPPPAVDADGLRRLLDEGEWVVDLRDRTAYAADHLTGTVSIGLAQNFATYLGWLFPYDRPLILLGETPEQVAAAQRQLIRIGIDRPHAATGTPAALGDKHPRGSFPVVTFADLPAAGPDDVVLDVRRADERAEGHVRNSLHIPLPDLPGAASRIPDAGSGCTVRAATARASPPACWPATGGAWSSSTTTSPTPSRPAWSHSE